MSTNTRTVGVRPIWAMFPCSTGHSPYLSVGEKLVSHTPEFAAACLSPKGMETAVLAAKALALTAYDLLTDGELLSKVKAEHGQASA